MTVISQQHPPEVYRPSSSDGNFYSPFNFSRPDFCN